MELLFSCYYCMTTAKSSSCSHTPESIFSPLVCGRDAGWLATKPMSCLLGLHWLQLQSSLLLEEPGGGVVVPGMARRLPGLIPKTLPQITLPVSPFCQIESLIKVGISPIGDKTLNWKDNWSSNYPPRHTFQGAIRKRWLHTSFGYSSNKQIGRTPDSYVQT